MHRIVNNLWLGSQQDADELVRNNPEMITAILNVRGPDAYDPPGRNQAAEHPGKAYKWIPAPDIETILPKHVREALLWLRAQGARYMPNYGFQAPAMDVVIRNICQQHNFQMQGHSFIIRGLCADCNRAKTTKRHLDLV